MLIKLPEGFGHRIHWEQFGIYHLTRGCRAIPSQMWFIFTLSVRHRWGREGGKQDSIQSLWKARGCRTAAAGARRVWAEEGSKGQTWCWRNTHDPQGGSGGRSSCEMWLLLCPPGTNPSSGRAGPFPRQGMSGWGHGWSWHPAPQLLWRRPCPGLPHAVPTRSKQEPRDREPARILLI